MGGSLFYYCNVESMRIDERIEGLFGTGGWWRNKEREQQNRKHCDYIGKCFYSPFKHQTRAALMGHQGCLVVHNNNHNSVWAWTGTDTGRGGMEKRCTTRWWTFLRIILISISVSIIVVVIWWSSVMRKITATADEHPPTVSMSAGWWWWWLILPSRMTLTKSTRPS